MRRLIVAFAVVAMVAGLRGQLAEVD